MSIHDLIPDDLHMTSAERLLLVADIIEQEPSFWDQGTFILLAEERETAMPSRDELTPMTIGLPMVTCGTTLCIAGWADMLTPKEQLAPIDRDSIAIWTEPARVALGISPGIGELLFYDIANDAKRFVDILRRLASLPEPREMDDLASAGIYVDEEGYLAVEGL